MLKGRTVRDAMFPLFGRYPSDEETSLSTSQIGIVVNRIAIMENTVSTLDQLFRLPGMTFHVGNCHALSANEFCDSHLSL